jgi:hypothetical protein
MRCRIDRKAVNELLDREVFDCFKMVRVPLLKDRDETAGACRGDSASVGIELDHIGFGGYGKIGDRFVCARSLRGGRPGVVRWIDLGYLMGRF